VSPSDAVALEQRVVRTRFGGSAAAYGSALAEVGASASVARGIVGDELRGRELAGRLATGRISNADVLRYRETFAPVLARQVSVSPAPTWLPEGRGVALATSAPAIVFQLATGRKTMIRTVEGDLSVEALDETTALAALGTAQARTAIVRELRVERRADAYAAWSLRLQKAAENKLVCERDRLPELGVADITSYAPFLSLDEPEAEEWLAARRARPVAS
jgi:hypothetical protein